MQFFIDPYFPDDINAVGDAGMASFDEKRPLYLSGCKQFLATYRQEIRELHSLGASGVEVAHLLCDMMDVLINKLLNSILYDLDGSGELMEHLTLVAVGGYGRGELNPFSDIDIMFLHDGSMPVAKIEDIAQKLLYFLWDMRLDVGYSVRVLNDCVEMAASDGTVKTALMDARFLSGSSSLYKALHNTIFTQILPRSSDKFIKEKIADMKARREKYGSTVYLLEPNLKEGEGGLRDLQTAVWVARIKYKYSDPKELIIKGIITEEELEIYHNALDYLWRIRNELHYFNGRKNDQLTFDAQVHLAQFFGYLDRGRVLAVEDFMRDYYRHANRVEHFTSSLVSRCVWRDEGALKILGYFVRRPVGDGCYVLKGELIIPDESVVEKNPVVLMRLFELAQKHQVELNVRVKGIVRRSLHLVTEEFRCNPEVNHSFQNILRSPKDVTSTLRLMHHLEFLNVFIPELEHIYCKVQHDIYHIYTVDIHTLFAVEEAEKMLNGQSRELLPFPCEVAAHIGKQELLLLAVMFHDVGKGEGGGHAEKGAAMIPEIARRMGLDREDTLRLEFLVRHHLLFAHISQRRDLHDEKMIVQFAQQMETSENLKMLYLLAIADVRAVGSDVWTNWKAMLFQELYEKSFQVLERGNFQLEERSDRVKGVIQKVVERLEPEFAPPLLLEELQAMSVRMLLSNSVAQIVEHARILMKLDTADMLITVVHQEARGYSDVTICAYDMPGLFARITGVMAANGVNILGAQINTSRNGKVVDVLQVNSPQGNLIKDEQRWQKIKNEMVQVFHGEVMVSTLVAKRQRPTLLFSRSTPVASTRVEIDNQISDDYTVIDIYAHDKVGLLYLITSTLTELGLYIGVSKISTKVDQVADTFYVRDIFGQKIVDVDKLAAIVLKMKTAIDEWV